MSVPFTCVGEAADARELHAHWRGHVTACMHCDHRGQTVSQWAETRDSHGRLPLVTGFVNTGAG